jgi:hypothetical protein
MADRGLFFGHRAGQFVQEPSAAIWLATGLGVYVLFNDFQLADKFVLGSALFYISRWPGSSGSPIRPDAERPYRALGYPVVPIVPAGGHRHGVERAGHRPAQHGITFGIILVGSVYHLWGKKGVKSRKGVIMHYAVTPFAVTPLRLRHCAFPYLPLRRYAFTPLQSNGSFIADRHPPGWRVRCDPRSYCAASS